MKYSIFNEKLHQRLLLDNTSKPYIDWSINVCMESLFRQYQQKHIIKTDISIFQYSLFNILCDLFVNDRFYIKPFCIDSIYAYITTDSHSTNSSEHLSDHSPCLAYNNIDQTNNSSQPFIHHVEENRIETLSYSFENEQNEQLSIFFNELIEKKSIIIADFHSFILGFMEYIQKQLKVEYSHFKTYYHILKNDMLFFKKTKLKSLSKYQFTIGMHSNKISGSRGEIERFIPGGTCFYGSKIFINSYFMNLKYGKLWFKRTKKRIFYHELGHALDYLYYNDVTLKTNKKTIRYNKKTISSGRSSHNHEFLHICKKNYHNLKKISPTLNKSTVNYFSYYSKPAIINLSIEKHNSIKKSNKFPIAFIVHNQQFDYTRALSESWAECFSFIFNWIHNGFSEYDHFILHAGTSKDRSFIKIQYQSLLYILENFDWSTLNISLAVYLKRKKHIKKLLYYVKKMPTLLNNKSVKKHQHRQYFTFNDLIK